MTRADVPHLRPRWLAARQLAVLVRDPEAAAQIMAPTLGAAGDPLYRARRDATRDRGWRCGAAAWW
ncbi:hypothetical protein [Kouleothrix sp.]|uniref:hypothetical protein n=1 Tax=Kouleothrix sp. TaxID=2779161 RepID=UPI00391D2107